MPEDLKNQGLCSNCKNAPTCMYLKDQKQPVWHCNEFCREEPCEKPPLKTTAPSLHKTKAVPQKSDGIASKYKGLCIDCVHRETCSLSKSPGGVWRCEEYE